MPKTSMGTRGPNYDWKHEAEHYRAECDKLRGMLQQMESSSERQIYELEAALKDYKDGGGFWGRTCSRQGEKIKQLRAQLESNRVVLHSLCYCKQAPFGECAACHANKRIDDILVGT